MNRKIILFLAVLCGLSLTEGVYANTSSPEGYCPRPLQFYAGMVGGVERMNGRRSESLSEFNAGTGATVVTTYSDNLRMLENNATLSLLGGFLWKLLPLPIVIGPEFYFGRGNARSTVTDTLDVDPVSGNRRLYSTEFQRKFFYGGSFALVITFAKITLSLPRLESTAVNSLPKGTSHSIPFSPQLLSIGRKVLMAFCGELVLKRVLGL